MLWIGEGSMASQTTTVDKPQLEIEELRNSAIWWSLPGLFLAAVALYSGSTTFSDPLHGAVPGAIFLLLPFAGVFFLLKSQYLVVAWVLRVVQF